jgi:hypothetical protein
MQLVGTALSHCLRLGLLLTLPVGFVQVRAVTGGYFVAIMLTFLGSMVGLKLPGLFSGGEAAAHTCTLYL